MSFTSIFILLICLGLIIFAVYSYLRTFIRQWRADQTWRPDGNEVAKLEQKKENLHRFRIREGFRDEDDSRNKYIVGAISYLATSTATLKGRFGQNI